ncbi:unnamed protein product, partial [Didymodactylos carnosus]
MFVSVRTRSRMLRKLFKPISMATIRRYASTLFSTYHTKLFTSNIRSLKQSATNPNPIISWNLALKQHRSNKQSEKGLKLFENLIKRKNSDIQPDFITYLTVL